MGNVIDAIDNRGYRIICTDDIWYGKILVSRPWMDGWEDLVREAIQNPSFICQDATHKNRNAYYMLHVTKLNRYIKVVAQFSPEQSKSKISGVICPAKSFSLAGSLMPSKD